MARSKSDISNSAIRIFLQEVGKYYDRSRGFDPFGPKKAQKVELLAYFDNECCFCGKRLDVRSLSQDHLVPMNKATLGLHAGVMWFLVVQAVIMKSNKRPGKNF